jgi:glucosamine--fructose-6-phosphate aminotransferase (isomerizing)
MFREAAEAPAAVRSQLLANRGLTDDLGQAIRELGPHGVVICARGSSDHAGTFAKYLIETRTGLVVSSAAPSVSSLYATKVDLKKVLFVAISQSGASPDLLAAAGAAREAGAVVLALVNAEGSPLARAAHHTVPLRAGPETSVAATKSYIASLAAILQLVTAWTQDGALGRALEELPSGLEQAWQLDWSPAVASLRPAHNLYVVARGLGLGIAREAALKFKETCGLHAEAFSAAELRHGPMALVEKGFPVLAFAQHDETREGTEELAAELVRLGAEVVMAGAAPAGAVALPTIRAPAAIEPVLMIQSFYRLANALAIARGRDPDRPVGRPVYPHPQSPGGGGVF